MDVVYEDNHLVVVNKRAGEIVQGDRTGDEPLSEMVKRYLKEKYSKPGNVFCGVVHRLDRPVAGLVVFARTGKALERMNRMFRDGEVHKTYWALVQGRPSRPEALLEDWLVSDGRMNKTFVTESGREGAKLARLSYRTIANGDRYTLLEVRLLTGRKHQIRAQLANIGCPVRGDLKYGARRSNPDGGISLQSHAIEFVHPVARQTVSLEVAPLPDMSKLLQ